MGNHHNVDDLIRFMEHQERTALELRTHAFRPEMVPLIDEIEATILANKQRFQEMRQSGNWELVSRRTR